MIPIRTATDTTGKRVNAYGTVTVIAVSPNGKWVYAGNKGGSVTGINTVTGKPEKPVYTVWNRAGAIVFSPDSKTAYVIDLQIGSELVTRIAVSTNSTEPFIPMPDNTQAMAITPDGSALYVTVAAEMNGGPDQGAQGPDEVVPVSTATNTPGTPIPTAGPPGAIGITRATCWWR